MKTSHALLALTAVTAAHLMQRERHHKQHKEMVLSGVQERWVSLLTTHPDLAAPWKPAHMSVEEYVKLLNANQQLCSLSLRYRLALVTKDRLRVYATRLMTYAHVRQYWQEFGPIREEEALGNARASAFNEILAEAYDTLI
ncbi:MAG TPA: DUF6082 family protein, partial [Streptomyces sp.]|uniref:DUF6082 family protein n=1 Tax=Streptomyces sp. TaxID=1931 RepID=UPI002BBBF782